MRLEITLSVPDRGFEAAAITSIRSAGPTLNTAESIETTRARDPEAARLLEQFAEHHPQTDRTTHPIRQHFGIRAFGINGFSASAGEPLIVPHSEERYGHEEVYLVVRGRMSAECDGERLELGSGEILHVAPQVERALIALETPTVIVAVGGIPGEAYHPPAWAPDAA